MLADKIKALIRDYNPWWDGKEIIVPPYKRYIFSVISDYLKPKQIITIVGLRRVGKTVIMKQIIKQLLMELQEKKEVNNLFYFLFDDLLTQNPTVLEEIIEYFLKTIASEQGRKYIFLDEIQKVANWQDILKRFYDTREDLKFIVSGSASLNILQSKESLAGRIFDIYLPILTYREFLEMNDIKIEKPNLSLSELRSVYDANLHKKVILEQMLLDYLIRGPFPELAHEKNEEIIRNYIKSSVIEHILLGDIPLAYNVRRKDILYALLEYCCKETSNLLDLTSLANILGVNYQTIKEYLFYLKDAFLIDLLFNYSESIAKELRKNKKVHIAHPAITIAILQYSKNNLLIEEIVSKYIETVVFQHARLMADRISFWRSPQKDEVDLVIETIPLLPIEVKYKNKVNSQDIAGLIKFLLKKNLTRGIIVTKDTLDEKEIKGVSVLFVPTWLFLLAIV
jgi:hypothetical protein